MKYGKHHVLSILIIIFMILLAVATSARPTKEIKNSISYETRGEYYLIKVKTKDNPKKYGILAFSMPLPLTDFVLYFPNYEEKQYFKKNESGEIVTEIYSGILEEEREKYMIDEKGERITEKYTIKTNKLLEQKILNDEDFGTFTENGYFIIKIRKEILWHENPGIKSIYFNSDDGKYLREIYYE
jgi:hypothetical protein